MKYSNRYIYFVFILLLSCNGALVYKEVDLTPETEAWIMDFDYGDSFRMTDENGISNIWELSEKSNYYNESSGAFLFVTTEKIRYELSYQKFRSSVLGQFMVGADAGFSEGEGSISFSTDLLDVSIDISTQKPQSFFLSQKTEEPSSWYAEDGDELPCQIKIVTDYENNGVVYPEEVVVFEMLGEMDYFEENDILKFSYSKQEGLIFLELKSGLKYYRE